MTSTQWGLGWQPYAAHSGESSVKMTEATLTSFPAVWLAAEPQLYYSEVFPQNTSAPPNHFHLQPSPCMFWRTLWAQLSAAFLPNYHSWSAGGKTDAVRCWLVHRHHTGLPLFLTDFSLSPWLHFYQQQSAWGQSQQLVVHKPGEVKIPWPCRCPGRQFGLRCFAFVLPIVLLLM